MSTEEAELRHGDERRQFFRVDDNVTLSYRLLADDEALPALAPEPGKSDCHYELISRLASISQEMNRMLGTIETEDAGVASYLKSLDRKVDVLGRAFLAYTSDLFGQPTSPVNLSASGIAFEVGEQLREEGNLELKLLLMPSFIGILAYGRVVSCDQSGFRDGGPVYLLRVAFTQMRESDRGHLIRYMIHRKSVELRENSSQR